MDTRIKNLWINALRSGEYKQGKSYLHQRDRQTQLYCCLGVLCVLAYEAGKTSRRLTKVPRSELGYIYVYDKSASVLPKSVMNWASLSSSDPSVYTSNFRYTYSFMNDNGFTFEEIATFIEEQ